MKFEQTEIEGLRIIHPNLQTDERGFFLKYYHSKEFKKNGIDFEITQVNQSQTRKKGTIRGIHFQRKPYEEAKIVQCLKGRVYDIVIDLRKNSLTYGKWHAEMLDSTNRKVIFIPKGFAHGFQTIEDNTEVLYLMSSEYSSSHSSGIRWDDPFFKINWPEKPSFIAEKDKNWPLFN